ncbi:hypothetical protein ABL78_5162 [Leptomonas seymouri]|uniref:Uncharacterized protein n=1 Tax=Leptomonas seymouri TaxID=5684 RepID=A0A0N1IK24_LEPSE|nr:hypothetical protein ABL78_5162 [Leptomonas seymouri]|eukprot:KPI85771.1 hypothetical protein ABL78_5162 [Leptomonas seymouri]
MELLSYVFQRHPSALRLHRELTIALASGDAARAADLAGVLASTVERVVATAETPPISPADVYNRNEKDGVASQLLETPAIGGCVTDEKTSTAECIPAPTPEDVEEAVEKTRRAVLQRAVCSPPGEDDQKRDRSATSSDTEAQVLPFWRDPQYLCVTVLESAFETDVPDGEAQDSLSAAGNRAAQREAEQVRILETYLEKEGVRWKAQKAAIAKIVLEVARGLKLTPEDLQATEGLTSANSITCEVERGGSNRSGSAGGKRLNVLRHSNLVVRGEIPSAAATPSNVSAECDVETQLAALEERMRSLGTPLSREEVQMARFELQVSQSKMRYVVGVHKELQYALDNSESVKEALQELTAGSASYSTSSAPPPPSFTTGTQLFVNEVIKALNEGAEAFSANATKQKKPLSVVDVQAREAAEDPVLPFTFMLKCCLWFDTATPS